MEKTKKYNLRSASSDTQMQTQLAGDMEFVTQLLGAGPSTSSQQGCESQSSDSELNCSDVINASDSDDTGSRNRSFSKFSTEQSGTSDSHALDTQTIINQQILAQLTDIGQRLQKLEKTDCKKSSDATKHNNKSTRTSSKPTANMYTKSTSQSTVNSAVPGTVTFPFNSVTVPSLADIRQNANIQEKVDQRIKALQQLSNTGTDSKIKSLRGGSVDIFVKNRVKWPHEHVLAGNIKERVSYDQLTMGQWMAGFCRTMREEKNKKNKEAMLDYLIALSDDSNDFSWAAAKASHAVLLCRMEQGEILDYTQTDLVDRVRRAHAQRHITHTSSNSTQNFKKFKTT